MLFFHVLDCSWDRLGLTKHRLTPRIAAWTRDSLQVHTVYNNTKPEGGTTTNIEHIILFT